MFGALLYLRLTSLRNLAVHRILRLRQPRYLVGAAVAAAYFYFVFARRPGFVGSTAASPAVDASVGLSVAAMICAVFCLVALIRIAYAWIAPAEKPGLRFSEAEISFLFPAPVSRKTLIHYRLLSSQAAILLTSVLIAFVFNRSGYLGGHRVFRALGWWVILSTFDLHVNGTKLTLARLRESGSHFVLWRITAVTAIVLYVVAVFWSAVGIVDDYAARNDFTPVGLNALVLKIFNAPLFHWLSLPFRIVLGPYFAMDARGFGIAMVPALLFLALHYAWVSNTGARFEEGSIELAEKRAAVRAAALRGEMPKLGNSRPKARSGPFPLPPMGPPETAFLWKNLLSMRSVIFSRRALIVVLAILVWMSLMLGPLLMARARRSGVDVFGPMIVVFSAMIAAYTVLLGPQIARQDLRNDLPNADLLKTYPIEGWRLALGELLAPTILLTVVLWATIIASAAAIDATGSIEWLTRGVRLTLAACLCSAAPLLCLIQLIVPNSIMVLLPAWYQASRSRAAGIEVFGQRLIFGIVQLFFALLVAVPAAGAAALVFFSSRWAVGISAGAILAAISVLTILAGEAAVGLWFLGERFEKFDLSTESR